MRLIIARGSMEMAVNIAFRLSYWKEPRPRLLSDRKVRHQHEGINGWMHFNDRVVFLAKYVIIP